MSDTSDDRHENDPDPARPASGFASDPARRLFGHKAGASPWEPPASGVQRSEPSAPPPSGAAEVPQTASAPYPRDAQYTPRPAGTESDTALEGDESIFDEVSDDGELRKLHPNYKLLMRVKALFAALVLIIVAFVAETALAGGIGLARGVVTLPALIVAGFLVIRLPAARYEARGYQISRDRLRVVRGVLFRSDTIVPFGRVQHIDVDQGPIDRALDIATMTLHTAGTHNASVSLPGLGEDLAIRMREEIRAHIKRETM